MSFTASGPRSRSPCGFPVSVRVCVGGSSVRVAEGNQAIEVTGPLSTSTSGLAIFEITGGNGVVLSGFLSPWHQPLQVLSWRSARTRSCTGASGKLMQRVKSRAGELFSTSGPPTWQSVVSRPLVGRLGIPTQGEGRMIPHSCISWKAFWARFRRRCSRFSCPFWLLFWICCWVQPLHPR